MYPVVLQRDSLSAHCLQCRTKARKIVGDSRIVLNVFIAVEVALQHFPPAIHQDVIDESAPVPCSRRSYPGLSVLSDRRSCVAAWVWTCHPEDCPNVPYHSDMPPLCGGLLQECGDCTQASVHKSPKMTSRRNRSSIWSELRPDSSP